MRTRGGETLRLSEQQRTFAVGALIIPSPPPLYQRRCALAVGVVSLRAPRPPPLPRCRLPRCRRRRWHSPGSSPAEEGPRPLPPHYCGACTSCPPSCRTASCRRGCHRWVILPPDVAVVLGGPSLFLAARLSSAGCPPSWQRSCNRQVAPPPRHSVGSRHRPPWLAGVSPCRLTWTSPSRRRGRL